MSTPGPDSERWWWDTATILSKSWDLYENRLLEIQFYDVSWCQMSSLVTPSWYLRKSPYVSWFIFKIIDFWCFLVDLWGSHVKSPGGECFAPPLIRRMSVPSFLLPNGIQMKNSRFRLKWCSTSIPTVSTPGPDSESWWWDTATILSNSWDFYENRLLEIQFYDVSWFST